MLRPVDRWLKKWQRRLRLQDWNITVQEGESGDAYAYTRWDPIYKEATITWGPEDGMVADGFAPEEILVHELLHIVSTGHMTFDGYVEDQNEERAISTIAKALYNGYKRSTKCPRSSLTVPSPLKSSECAGEQEPTCSTSVPIS